MNILIQAQLEDQTGEPGVGLTLRVQNYSLRELDWKTVASAKTTPNGVAKFKIDNARKFTQTPSLGLRLVTARDRKDIVLSDGPVLIHVEKEAETVHVDFGKIVLFADVVRERGSTLGADIQPLPVGGATTGQMQGFRESGSWMEDIRWVPGGGGQIGESVIANAVNSAVEDRVAELRQREAVAVGERLKAEAERDEAKRAEVTAFELVRSATLKKQDAETELADHQTRIATLESQSATLSKSLESKTDISVVMNQVGLEFAKANKTLQAGTALYKVDDIKITLKGQLADGGRSMVLNPVQAAAGSIATVEAGLASTSTGLEGPKIIVPDLSGLTESAGKRVLLSLGLKVRLASTPALPGMVPGQTVSQSPKAGTNVAHGTEIILVIARG